MKGVSVFPIYEEKLGLYCSARHPIAVLPGRLARRQAGVLKEIILPKAERQPDLGRYQVCMVSETNCDPAEDEFLIAELRSLC